MGGGGTERREAMAAFFRIGFVLATTRCRIGWIMMRFSPSASVPEWEHNIKNENHLQYCTPMLQEI